MIDNNTLLQAIKNKDKRVKTLYNLEPALKNELSKEAKTEHVNSSDILNYILYERYFKTENK